MLTVWTCVYTVLATGVIFVLAVTAQPGRNIVVEPWILVMLVLLVVTLVLGVVLAGALIADVFRNPAVPRDQQAVWATVLAVGGFLVFPYYWYRYIWRT